MERSVCLPLGMSLPVGKSTSGAWGIPEAAAVLTAMALADLAGFKGCHPVLCALCLSKNLLASFPPTAPTAIYSARFPLSLKTRLSSASRLVSSQ